MKYINTSAPALRDGLLRNDLETVSNTDPVFYPSIHQYYEHRPSSWTIIEKGRVKEINGETMCLAEWVSFYDHVASGKVPKGNILFEGMNGHFRKRGRTRTIFTSTKLISDHIYV